MHNILKMMEIDWTDKLFHAEAQNLFMTIKTKSYEEVISHFTLYKKYDIN